MAKYDDDNELENDRSGSDIPWDLIIVASCVLAFAFAFYEIVCAFDPAFRNAVWGLPGRNP